MTSRTARRATLGAGIVMIAAGASVPTLLQGAADAPRDAGGQLRQYFIQAEEATWDYAPDRRNRVAGQRFGDDAAVFVKRSADRIGSRYRKALFRGYTDATFKTRLDQGDRWEHLGMLGPVIHAEVGDAVQIVLRNDTRRPVSLHAHGLRYDWWAVGDAEGSVMIALRRADVADLNERARQRMRSARGLGHDELDLPGGRFAVGDHVLVRQNHVELGISNGERAVVTEIDIARHRLELQVGGRRVTLDRAFLDARTVRGDPTLTHGYAITGHAAQGITVDRAFVLADPALTQEWGYTALTRGRDANHLYLAATRSRWRDEYAPGDPEPPDPIAQLARAPSTSRVQALAIDATSSEHAALAEARLELDRLQSERTDAERLQRRAARRRAELERRSTRWRPRLRRELAQADAVNAASSERVEELRLREADQARRVHALTLADREPGRPRGDRQARALQRRLERATERDIGRGLEL